MTYVTDEMRALIGVQTDPHTAPEPIGQDALRRFVHATMEENPIHWDAEAARASRFGSVVAPPLYPVHAFRRAVGTPDPLDRAKEDPEYDGSLASRASQLKRLNLPLKRRLNAGSEVEFFQFAEAGDLISETSAYASIEHKESSSGPMVLETVATEYTNQRGETLIKVYKTSINR